MTTTLTVLGGSAASVGTGQGCAGYLVEHAGTRVVLDLGPGTLQELRKHTDFRTLAAVVISHLHVDHILDVVALRFALAYNPVKPADRMPLWLPPGGRQALGRVGEAFAFEGDASTFFDRVFDAREYDPATPLTVGALTLTFAPTVHWVPCWAMRVHPADDAGDLFYSADTGPAANLTDLASGASVALIEATTPLARKDEGAFEQRGHLTIEQAASLAATAGASTFVVTHMFEEHDPAASLLLAQEAFDGKIVRAMPGTVVAWP